MNSGAEPARSRLVSLPDPLATETLMCTFDRRPNGKLARPPVFSPLRPFPVAASLVCLLALALLPLRAANPWPPSDDFPGADTQLTFKARAALRDADGLTFLNLG